MSKIFDNIQVYGTGTTFSSETLSVLNSAGTTTFSVRDNSHAVFGTEPTPTYPDTNVGNFFNNGAIWAKQGLYVDSDIRNHSGNIGGNEIKIGDNGGIYFWSEYSNPTDGQYTYGGQIYTSSQSLKIRGGLLGVSLLGGQTATLGINVGYQGHVGVLANADATYGFKVKGTGGAGELAYFETYSGDTSLILKNNGNVGVGVSPSVKLHTKGNSGFYIESEDGGYGSFKFRPYSTQQNYSSIQSSDGDELRWGGALGSPLSNGEFAFYNTAYTDVRLAINHLNPNATIHAVGNRADNATNTLIIQNSAGTNSLLVRDDGRVLIQTLTAGLGSGNIATNTVFGTSALNSNTTGFQNTAIGNNSLYTNTTPSGNTAVGHGALYLNGGSGGGFDNTAIGNEAMVLNNTATANYNTAVGSLALRSNTAGWDNTAVGYKAGNNTDILYGSNSIGRHNTWVGWKAASVGSALDDVYYTTVVGWSGNVRGTGAVSVGANSVVYSANSVSLGYSNSVNGTNSIAIGSNVNIYADNTMVLGNGVNVGIGTVSPSEKLEISGNTKLSSLSYSYNIGNYTAIKMSQGVGASNISLGHSNTLNDSGNGGAIAIGQSVTSSDDGIAIGLFSTVAAGTTDGIAIGRSATINNSSIRGIAIGRDSLVSANNAFAIGNYTTAYQDNTIIIGNNSSGSKPNIGISTSTPAERLHVSGGTIRINTTNGTEGAGKLAVSDANGSISFSSTTALGLGAGSVNKYTTSTAFTAGTANYINHNLGLADATDAIVQIWSGNSLTLGGEVSAVTTNQIAVTVSVTGTYKIVVMG